MTEVNFYDGKIHKEWGGKQPVPNGTSIRAWTVGGGGAWEGRIWPAEMWCWSIEGNSSDIKEFQVVQ